MITMTDLCVAPAVAQTLRRFDVPAARYGNTGLVARSRGWRPSGIALASKHSKSAAPDPAPFREILL